MWAGWWGIFRGGSEGEKWLRSIFQLLEEKSVPGLRTGIWEWKHSTALQNCCFFSLARLVSVLLFALCGVTGHLQLSALVTRELWALG